MSAVTSSAVQTWDEFHATHRAIECRLARALKPAWKLSLTEYEMLALHADGHSSEQFERPVET